MTRVLVSGGTGFVGRFIVEHLLANGYEVTVGGRSPPPAGFYSQPVSHVPLRLDADADQAGAFDHIYYFVHAAFEHVEGRYRGGEGDDPPGVSAAPISTAPFAFSRKRAPPAYGAAFFLSSRAVYGETAPPVVAETSPVEPDTFYGQVKLATENALKSMTDHSFVTTSLRVTGVYGPRRLGTKTQVERSLFRLHCRPAGAKAHRHGSPRRRCRPGRPPHARNRTGENIRSGVQRLRRADRQPRDPLLSPGCNRLPAPSAAGSGSGRIQDDVDGEAARSRLGAGRKGKTGCDDPGACRASCDR
ncbi:SDR family oxidoreductase [Sinorhizobium meliloti]|nr:SDR family oxidoreductase [Sinorhizobium meliloti]